MTKLEKLLNQPETSMSRKINGQIIKVWWVNNKAEITNLTTGQRLGSFENNGPHFNEEKFKDIIKEVM